LSSCRAPGDGRSVKKGVTGKPLSYRQRRGTTRGKVSLKSRELSGRRLEGEEMTYLFSSRNPTLSPPTGGDPAAPGRRAVINRTHPVSDVIFRREAALLSVKEEKRVGSQKAFLRKKLLRTVI